MKNAHLFLLEAQHRSATGKNLDKHACQFHCLEATSGVTFGGASLGVDGSWSPSPPQSESVPTSGNNLAWVLAAASAVLVEVTITPTAPPSADGPSQTSAGREPSTD